jgi:predicted TIM-barrel fold metal-dependent hydrolase
MKIKIIDAEVRLVHPEAMNTSYAKNRKEKRVHKTIYKSINHKKKINHLWSIDALLNSMKKNKVSCAFLGTLLWASLKIQKLNNDYIDKIVEQYPKKFYVFYSLHLLEVKKWQELSSKDFKKKLNDLKKKKNFIGFEVEPHYIKHSLINPKFKFWSKIFRYIEEKKIPLRITGRHPHQHQINYIYRFLVLVKKYPKIKFFITAAGGSLPFYEELPVFKKLLKNVNYISSTPSTPSMIKAASYIVPNKIMFGTDFPFNHSLNQQYLLKKMKSMKLKKNIYRKIMYQNSQKLLKNV